ncbi:hypothetical protein DPMN_123616 [Dreissena polymorpha]|uniref:Uncharacterized protein n=3 Tax=Dreissena polymorpha TaxID=45954 RepID=A0A9D4GU33_DREPO|nr:hypothetical protein DPMN_123616 [Dreissena polymorpha]
MRTTFYHVTDRLLGLEPWINTTTSCTFPEPWRTANDTDSSTVEDAVVLTNAKKYEGFYSSPYVSGIHVEEDDTSNTSMRFRMGNMGGALYATVDKDRFFMEIRTPWELSVMFIDQNNVTAKTNVTFIWTGDHVNSLQAHFPVPVNFTRRTHAGETAANSCDPLYGSVCLIRLINIPLLCIFLLLPVGFN